MNYEWIRPGVKAVIIRGYDEVVGEVVNVTSHPYRARSRLEGLWLGCNVAEGAYLAAKIGCPSGVSMVPSVVDLIPYHEPGSWDADVFEHWNPIKQPEEMPA